MLANSRFGPGISRGGAGISHNLHEGKTAGISDIKPAGGSGGIVNRPATDFNITSIVIPDGGALRQPSNVGSGVVILSPGNHGGMSHNQTYDFAKEKSFDMNQIMNPGFGALRQPGTLGGGITFDGAGNGAAWGELGDGGSGLGSGATVNGAGRGATAFGQ